MALERLFELVLLADQQPVLAGWLQAANMPHELRETALGLLSPGPTGRAALPVGPSDCELHWTFEPGRGITTVRRAGKILLLSVVLGGQDAARDDALLDSWITSLRRAPAVRAMNKEDPEAFEVFRHLRDRPMVASVLLPEGTREECRALLEFHRAVAANLLDAVWGNLC